MINGLRYDRQRLTEFCVSLNAHGGHEQVELECVILLELGPQQQDLEEACAVPFVKIFTYLVKGGEGDMLFVRGTVG